MHLSSRFDITPAFKLGKFPGSIFFEKWGQSFSSKKGQNETTWQEKRCFRALGVNNCIERQEIPISTYLWGHLSLWANSLASNSIFFPMSYLNDLTYFFAFLLFFFSNLWIQAKISLLSWLTEGWKAFSQLLYLIPK